MTKRGSRCREADVDVSATGFLLDRKGHLKKIGL
jgi:hypothetical protein